MAMPRAARAGAPRVVTVGEASEILHVHPNTLRKWSDSGLIPSYRIGQRRDRRFVLEDLIDFLERDGDKRLDRPSPSPSPFSIFTES